MKEDRSVPGSRPQEVFPGVFLVGGPELTHPQDCLVYAIDGEREVVLVDTGAGRSAGKILENLEMVGLGGKPLSKIILTHCHVDHIGGAKSIAQRTGAKIVCHRGDLQAIERGDPVRTASSWYGVRLPELKVDMVIVGSEEEIQVGGTSLLCLHTPGHTPGSISLLWEKAEGRILFGQDIHGPFLPEFGSDLQEWTSSMKKLLALEPDILCEGHYGIFPSREETRRFILECLAAQGFEI